MLYLHTQNPRPMLRTKFIGQNVETLDWATSDGSVFKLKDLPHDHLSNIYWLYRTKLHFNHRMNHATSVEELNFSNALGNYIKHTYGGIGQYNPVTPDEVEVLAKGGLLRENGAIFIGGDYVGHTNIKLPPTALANVVPDTNVSRMYNNFTFHPNNRPIDLARVKQLKKSIARDNSLHERPIVVDTNYRIVDGQHRFQAARELGLPIYYSFEEVVTKADPTPAINTAGGPFVANSAIRSFLSKSGITPAPLNPIQPMAAAPEPTPIIDYSVVSASVQAGATDAELAKLQDRALLTWAIIRQDLNIGENAALNKKAVSSLFTALQYAYEQGQSSK